MIDRDRFDHASWSGSARYVESSGRFSHCVVENKYRPGSALRFVYGTDGLTLVVSNQNWALTAGAIYPVTATLDGDWRHATEAVGVSGARSAIGVIAIRLGHSRVIIDRLKGGRRLTISAVDETSSFDLSGSTGALVQLQQCLRRHQAKAGPAKRNQTTRSRLGLTAAKSASFDVRGRLAEHIWMQRAHQIAIGLLDLFPKLDRIDEFSRAHIDGAVTVVYARHNVDILHKRLTDGFTGWSKSLTGISPPSSAATAARPGIDRQTERELLGLRDAMGDLITETEQAFEAAIRRDPSTTHQLFAKSLAERIVKLRTEIVALRTQRAVTAGGRVRSYLDRAHMHGNTALLLAVGFAHAVVRGMSVPDGAQAAQSTNAALLRMEAAIDHGREIAQRGVETRRVADRTTDRDRLAFTVERDIAGLIGGLSKHVFAMAADTRSIDTRELATVLRRRFLALDGLAKQRRNLAAQRIVLKRPAR